MSTASHMDRNEASKTSEMGSIAAARETSPHTCSVGAVYCVGKPGVTAVVFTWRTLNGCSDLPSAPDVATYAYPRESHPSARTSL